MERKQAIGRMDKMVEEMNTAPQGSNEPSQTDLLWKEVATVIDPEIGLSLKELGLIYSIDVDGDKASVKMTLTSMGCPAGPELTAGVNAACLRVPGISDAEV